MKQTKLDEYRPNYPKKILRAAVLTTAMAVAVTGTTGCAALRTGGVPEPVPTEEVQLEGYVMPEPTPEEITEMGDVAIDDGAQP